MQVSEPHDAARLLQIRRAARESLEAYAGYIEVPDRPVGEEDSETFTVFEGGLALHHQIMCRAIQRCVEKRHGRLMIMAPPGSAKSAYTSVVAPTWIMGKWPGKRIILASYGSELAEKQSKKARSICRSARYQTLFSTSIPNDQRAADQWALANGSTMMCGGILSGLTGNRGDCFPAGTLVSTPAGSVPIESLVCGDNVTSFDHSKDCYTTSRVLATRKVLSGEIVEVQMASGRRFRCTADHRVFTKEHGYRQAQLLGAGDCVVQSPEGSGVHSLPEMLFRSSGKYGSLANMSELQEWVQNDPSGLREAGFQDRSDGYSLQPILLHSDSARSSGGLFLHQVWSALRQGSVVLLEGLLARSKEKARQGLFAVQEAIRKRWLSASVLFSGMCEPRPFHANDRAGELPLQGRNELCGVVSPDAAGHYGEGWRSMRGVWQTTRAGAERKGNSAGQHLGSPLRRESGQQFAREPDSHVSAVSYQAPQVSYDTVSMVARIGGEPVEVYDIQVEATQCFFANEILVHNCVIADDLLKGRNEAESDTIRTRTWEAYRDDLRSRLVSGGSLILMNTRWHQQDVSGMILPTGWSGESGVFLGSDGLEWEVISLPAKVETPLQESTDPLGRKIGEYLWPDYWDLAHWQQSDPALGARDTNTPTGRRAWYSMYQQIPHPDDGILFKREDFRWYEKSDLPARLRHYMAGDWALTDELLKPDPDYTEIGVAGLDDGKNEAGAPALWLLDWYTARKDSETTVPAFVRLLKKWRSKVRMYFGEQGNIETLVGPMVKRECRDRKVPELTRKMLPTAGAGNKVAKASAFKKLVEEGRVYLPVGADWAERLVDQCCAFPGGSHDDMVDVGSLFGRAMDVMVNAAGAAVSEEREKALTPFTYEWHERTLKDEMAAKAERGMYFE